MTPLLSIVVPTYNRSGVFFLESISSILNQSHKDFEVIIVDDGSTDDTKSFISSFHDKRIIYTRSDSNRGEYWATNTGANLAKGKYLTWVHTDDILPQDSLKHRLDLLESHQSLDFVHGDIVKIDTNGSITESLPAAIETKEEILSQYMLPSKNRTMKYLVHHTTVMMHWNFFYKAGPFDCSLPFAGDIDWLIRAIRVGNFRAISSILYQYRTHPNTRRVLDVKNGINKEEVEEMIIRRYK